MATHDASVKKTSVKKTLPAQEDVRNHREHCSADPQLLATIGCAVGQQVRIIRSSEEYGLYTVSEVRQKSPGNVVRLGLTGRRRLGTDREFDGVLDAQVPHPTMTEDEAESASEFIEQLADDGRQSGLIALAPHGGDIERYTDRQAERVASRLAAEAVSSWRCKGWKRGGGALLSWHITSTDIHEASFPRLNSVISRGFVHAVAFHGLNDAGILIGGAASAGLKQEISTAIDGAIAGSGITVRIARPGDGFGGDDPRNVVNRLTACGTNGIQIEQSLQARTHHWQAIADAVAGVYRPRLPAGT